MDATETPRNISFCTYAIAEEEYLIVPDAKADKLFANNPLVTGSPYIRAYAGAILRNKDGYELGTLCLLFDEPRDFLDVEIESLKTTPAQLKLLFFQNTFQHNPSARICVSQNKNASLKSDAFNSSLSTMSI